MDLPPLPSLSEDNLKEKMEGPFVGTHWVVPGRVLCGAYPTADGPIDPAQLKELGFTDIVNLHDEKVSGGVMNRDLMFTLLSNPEA